MSRLTRGPARTPSFCASGVPWTGPVTYQPIKLLATHDSMCRLSICISRQVPHARPNAAQGIVAEGAGAGHSAPLRHRGRGGGAAGRRRGADQRCARVDLRVCARVRVECGVCVDVCLLAHAHRRVGGLGVVARRAARANNTHTQTCSTHTCRCTWCVCADVCGPVRPYQASGWSSWLRTRLWTRCDAVRQIPGFAARSVCIHMQARVCSCVCVACGLWRVRWAARRAATAPPRPRWWRRRPRTSFRCSRRELSLRYITRVQHMRQTGRWVCSSLGVQHVPQLSCDV